MNYTKTIRDPMYGYITIEAPFAQLLDTEEFQRLRNIRQTGYQSLYPSALHNRFVHSLGVFHLGKKALGYFEKNINIQNDAIPGWDEINNTFLTACLLHDVGHSPFSHTGEEYYTKGCNFEQEYTKLLNVPSDWKEFKPNTPDEEKKKRFFTDLSQSKDGTGKPHEAMSTLLGLELCRRENIAIAMGFYLPLVLYSPNYQKLSKAVLQKRSYIVLINIKTSNQN